MLYLSEQEYEKKLSRIRARNESAERKHLLKNERSKYSRKLRLPSTSKLLLWTAVLLCVEVLVFCEYMCLSTGDTSFLYSLASIPTTLVPTILGYYNKSKSENTVGGIVFETAIGNMNTDSSGEAVG